MTQTNPATAPSLDKDGRHTHFPNAKGELQPVPYPKGKTYAVCDAVTIIAQSKNRYAVVYGLQVRENLSQEDAAAEFGQCVCHQSESQGKAA